MAPHDHDGSSDEDDLIARVIPLRRRAAKDGAAAPVAVAERPPGAESDRTTVGHDAEAGRDAEPSLDAEAIVEGSVFDPPAEPLVLRRRPVVEDEAVSDGARAPRSDGPAGRLRLLADRRALFGVAGVLVAFAFVFALVSLGGPSGGSRIGGAPALGLPGRVAVGSTSGAGQRAAGRPAARRRTAPLRVPSRALGGGGSPSVHQPPSGATGGHQVVSLPSAAARASPQGESSTGQREFGFEG
jgi:hypothetical protein